MNDNPTHEERERMLSNEHDGPVGPDAAADLPLLTELLADPATWAEPRPGLEDDVVEAVAAAEPRMAPPTKSATPATPAHTSRRRRFAIAAVGVAAALILGSVALTVAQRGARTDFNAHLVATALAPTARGSAAISRNGAGFRVVLDARGLPALPAGEYYQAWLKNAEGVLVPIGTFSSSDGRVTLWSGVSPAEYPAFSVTIESADNNQASSGRRVLTGEVRPA